MAFITPKKFKKNAKNREKTNVLTELFRKELGIDDNVEMSVKTIRQVGGGEFIFLYM